MQFCHKNDSNSEKNVHGIPADCSHNGGDDRQSGK
jgi:hypothetical protein